MTTNVEITQEEINRLINYEEYVGTNPCFECKDVGSCCGCPTQREWTAKYDEMKSHIDPECFNNSNIMFYVGSVVKLKNLEKQMARLETEHEETVRLMKEYLTKFTICYGDTE